MAGIKKLANERAKKANLHNRKLRDCRFHLNDEPPNKGREEFVARQSETHDIYYRGGQCKRLYYEIKECRYPGCVQPPRQAPEFIWID